MGLEDIDLARGGDPIEGHDDDGVEEEGVQDACDGIEEVGGGVDIEAIVVGCE